MKTRIGIFLAVLCVIVGGRAIAMSRVSNHVKTKEAEMMKKSDAVPLQSIAEEPRRNNTEYENIDDKIKEIIGSMTLEEKIAQLFVVTPEALTGVQTVVQAGESTRLSLREYPVGGLIYFKKNLQSSEQTKEMLKNTKDFSKQIEKFPIILAVDEEGGRVSRIAGRDSFSQPALPNMAQIGATGDEQKAYDLGNSMGAYLSEYGFNMDFAPDADVLTNPKNKVIGDRSFGSDPELVWNMASQVAQGLSNQGIQPVYKHFPGHGGTLGDTHKGFSYTDKTLDQLMAAELVPFNRAVQAGADCIMVAHISVPEITGDDTPASLSSTIITEVLRKQMGYQGVVITDALNMGAISKIYSSDEAAVMSIQAGADLLLMPADFKEAYYGVLRAVKENKIDEARIDESLLRIGRMKLKKGS